MKHGNEWIHMANIWRGDQNYNWMVQNLRGANGMENKYVISCHKNCLFFLLFIFALFAFKRDAPVGERLCIVCNPGRVPNPEPSISYVL